MVISDFRPEIKVISIPTCAMTLKLKLPYFLSSKISPHCCSNAIINKISDKDGAFIHILRVQ